MFLKSRVEKGAVRERVGLNGGTTLEIALDLLCVLRVASINLLVEFAIALVDVRNVLVVVVEAASVELLAFLNLHIDIGD